MRPRSTTVALVMLDLDDFKKVNDVFGHGVGDQLLMRVADALRSSVRSEDVVSRVGGEEFAIILPSVTCEARSRSPPASPRSSASSRSRPQGG